MAVSTLLSFVRTNYEDYHSTPANYTTQGETIIGVTDTSAVRTITIASSSISDPGYSLLIQDESGAAATNNIIVATQGSETIDGAATTSITSDYGAVLLYSNGTELFSGHAGGSGLGTMAYQNANAIAVTGGTLADVVATQSILNDYHATAGDYTTSKETIIGVTDTSVVRTVTVSSADIANEAYKVLIQDESGAAGTNNIVIATEGSETIDGAATTSITSNYGGRSNL